MRSYTLIPWRQSGIPLPGQCVSSPRFIHSIIYLHSVWTHGYLFYILGYNPRLCYLICYSNYSSFGHWKLSIAYVPLIYNPHCMSMCTHACMFEYLLSNTTKWPMRILYISCPNPRISHCSREPQFLSLENGIRSQILRTIWACCYWNIVASRPSQLTEQRNTCVYKCVYTHFCKYFSM